MDHRLFEVDVLAGFHRVDGGVFMPVVGGGDDDGVNVFAGKNLAIVAGGKDIVAPELPGVGEPAVVAVGDSDQFHPWNLQRVASVTLALDSGADEGELDHVVRGPWCCG